MPRHHFLIPAVLLLASLLGGCAVGPEKADEVEDAHAEAVVAAARGVLGHDQFSVCYVQDSNALLTDGARSTLGGLIGPSTTVKGTAAGLVMNHENRADVVVDGQDLDKADRMICAALKLIELPLPGLDLVLLQPPSRDLQEQARQKAITLHVAQVAG